MQLDVLQRVIGAIPRIQVTDFDADAQANLLPSMCRG
jgi:hypothetical protein